MQLFREGFMWSPIDTYVDAISARSQLRGWGLDSGYVKSALADMRDHQDVLHPSAVKLFLGKGAGYDWTEANMWLSDALDTLDSPYFDECTEISHMNGTDEQWFHYARNSAPTEESGIQLAPSYLDLDTFNLKEDVPWQDRDMMLDLINTRPSWPGTDLVWLFALNPEMFLRGWDRWRSYVNLYMPGIVLTSEVSDQAARDSGASTGWGFIPEFQTRGPVSHFAHRCSSVGPGMCFVSYAD